ncbi:MAG: hypothetical protein A2068_02300 [Ignavibacteria bacterium GWB2_35_6b]|nr:MAG: hypothetical protein A2068_02300 [Ignavibacteria bacterium GWB2_35_6b]
MQKITPFLWFDKQAEEAANFYTSIFSAAPVSHSAGKTSKIINVSRYDEAGAAASGMPKGTAMVVAFELDGLVFTALNAGPHFKFTEAISFVVNCDSQEEVDYFWDNLSEGGDPKAQQCAWLKDKYGLSWQIVPQILMKLMSDSDPAKAQRVTAAMLQMKKIIIADLQKAYDDK